MNNLNYLTKITLSLLILTLFILGGCSSKPDLNLVPIEVTHVSQTKAWEMQGKLAVRTPQDKFSTNLYWLHTDKQDELRLTTMLGTTVMSLSNNSSGASLTIEDKTYRDKDAERLLKRLTGWSIPIESLPLWITGQVADTDKVISTDEQTRPQLIQSTTGQQPWQVSFKRWQQQSGAELPQLLELSRENIRLKIQINQWQALTENLDNQSSN
ncbi:lipoprotein insertase outer membrane protein LolB [Shewanella sp. Isolate11]|uniref:lipoprotein insertase outer membrane protein LolB n=1 Tax=Shewanella sp. Isolate11 TaxID=2908530 RepID=UPI001EFED3CC|nr:lipoprotein insertase outer membrane protein LolB [Shewanella sp. Isolate11]MCG9697401.1 lipoprotein insertase outer membrane protein LolB [Shewanella sp. Isolate11]